MADVLPLSEQENNPWILVFHKVVKTQRAVKELKKRGFRVFAMLVRDYVEENHQENSKAQVKP